MRALVLGAGAVGTRLARQLASTEGVDEARLRDPDGARLAANRMRARSASGIGSSR